LPLLEIKDLAISLTKHGIVSPLVRGVSFAIEEKETLAVVGESGCGKSLTSLAIMGLLGNSQVSMTSGSIKFYNREVTNILPDKRRELMGNQMAMIFQEPMTSLNPVYKIGDQIVESLLQHKELSRAQARARAIELLDLVRIPEPKRRIENFPHQMSGGQRQRVMIAMALSCEPKLLIADEPTTALDVTIQAEILDLISTLQNELGMAIMFITHDMAVAAEISNKIIVMEKGYIVERGEINQVFISPKHPHTQKLLDSVRRLSDAKSNNRKVSRNAAQILRVKNLHKHFQTGGGLFGKKSWLKAVNGISFEICEGEVLGLVGESGCGKSTVGRTLIHLEKATSGQALFDNQQIFSMSVSKFRPLRRDIQMIFQDPYASLNPRLKIEQILSEPLFIHGLVSSKHDARILIQQTLESVGLDCEVMQRYPHEFSGGQRQRISIARVMILKPRLIIADEAVSALDVSVQAQVLRLIKKLQSENNISMLFISHDLGVVRHLSDRVAVMYQGRIVEIGDKNQIFDAPTHEYTKKLLASIPQIKERDAL
tara:strand:- start:1622 stop:3247 length:1626 start_codon:yes stop_codon:yes gene_type:complete